MYLNMYVCNVCVYICMYVRTFICMYICMCLCICMYVYCIGSAKSPVTYCENHVVVSSCTVHVCTATIAGSQLLQNVSMCTAVLLQMSQNDRSGLRGGHYRGTSKCRDAQPIRLMSVHFVEEFLTVMAR